MNYFLKTLLLVSVSLAAEIELSHRLEDSYIRNSIDILEKVINGEKLVREFCFGYEKSNMLNEDRYACVLPSSCAELYGQGFTTSGVYIVHPKPWMKQEEIEVECDMEKDGGGWTILQKRVQVDGKAVKFDRTYEEYAEGFGQFKTEYWLGNENIHILTTQENVILRINMKDFEGSERHAEYRIFQVNGTNDDYRITVGDYDGNAGNGLEISNGAPFRTYDKNSIKKKCKDDKDCDDAKCAENINGGWWYHDCDHGSLNGKNNYGFDMGLDNIFWLNWTGSNLSLAAVEMKIRPKGFEHF